MARNRKKKDRKAANAESGMEISPFWRQSSGRFPSENLLLVLAVVVLLIAVVWIWTGDSGYRGFQHQRSPLPAVSQDVADKVLNKLEQVETQLSALSGKENRETGTGRGLDEHLDRLEATLLLQFKALSRRLVVTENRIAALQEQIVSLESRYHTEEKADTVSDKPAALPEKTVSVSAGTLIETQPAFHHVKPGETIYSISRLYNIPVALLNKWNHLASSAVIHPGQKIRLTSP